MTIAALEKDLSTLITEIRDPECWQDPYFYYRRLRAHDPILRTTDGKLVLTSHRACRTVLADARWEHFPELLCMSGRVFERNEPCGAMAQPVRPQVIDSLPDRKSLREKLARDFTPRAVLTLRHRIENIADQLVDQVLDKPTVDFIDAFVVPLTSTVLAEAFGVPPMDRQIFRKWSSTLRGAAESSFGPVRSKVSDADVAQTSREVDDYLKSLITERRRAPKDDLLSMLLSAPSSERQWNDDEITAVIVSIIVVGHHTTTAFIGNGALALSRHPDQLAKLRDTPEIADRAVEELLRYDAPAQFVSRFALEEMQLDDYSVVPGDVALLFIGAANRDPESFVDPDRLDLTRTPNDHLAFSQGHAYCFGAPLARLVGRLVFTTLARRVPQLAPNGEPVHFDTIGLRGVAALPVRTC